jgi:hypothetical protein
MFTPCERVIGYGSFKNPCDIPVSSGPSKKIPGSFIIFYGWIFLMKKWILLGVMLGMLMAVSMISGCTNSHAAEVEQASALIESASSRMAVMSSANFSTVSVSEIRANASAAKSDLTEAEKILKKIPRKDLNQQSQAEMDAVLPLIGVYIEMMDTIGGPFADFIGDAQTASRSRDPATVSDAGTRMKQDLGEMKLRFGTMSTEINAIDDTGLSPKTKGDLIYIKSMINSLSEEVNKADSQLAGACIRKCAVGQVLGQDCVCHPACGKSYCSSGAVCCKNVCYLSPGPNYHINMDTCYYQ